jgi:hypothetical protein
MDRTAYRFPSDPLAWAQLDRTNQGQADKDYLQKLIDGRNGVLAALAAGAASPAMAPSAAEDRFFFRVREIRADSDGDGLADWDEYASGANSWLVDSDGDGVDDNTEFLAGSRPNNPLDRPFDSAHPPAYADLWVDDGIGDDLAGDGSADLPFRTIEKAVEEAQPGDLIGVREGSYRVNTTPLEIAKPLRLVAVDGPERTTVEWEEGVNEAVRLSPSSGGASWQHPMPLQPGAILPADESLTVLFHGFRFVEGKKGPLFFGLPGTRLVLANCNIISALCGLGEFHSSHLYLLGCQVAESGDAPRLGEPVPVPEATVWLRGQARAEIWNCTLVDNVKTEATLLGVDSSRFVVRNSILWEYDGEYIAYASDATDPLLRVTQIEVHGEAQADVQSSLVFRPSAQVGEAWPHPDGGVANLPSSTDPLLGFYAPAGSNPERDLRTRRPGYSSGENPVPSIVCDAGINVAGGTEGPLGYRNLLRYDLLGRARTAAYRKNLVTVATTTDLGAVELVSTVRDTSLAVQPVWTDVTGLSLSATSNGLPRLAVSARDRAPAGRMLTLDPERGGTATGPGVQANLNLDAQGALSTVAALAFDASASRLHGVGDQRRSGVAESTTPDRRILSRSRGSADSEPYAMYPSDTLAGSCTADYADRTLRGFFQTIATGSLPSASATQRTTPEVPLAAFLSTGSSGASPTPYNPATGLRAALRAAMNSASINDSAAPYAALKPVNGYPDGVLIAWNTQPKFGQPQAGMTYAVGASLPYAGGGPSATAGVVLEIRSGSSTTEQVFTHPNPPRLPNEESTLYYRAWPYAGSGGARVYGPAFDASLRFTTDSNNTPLNQPLPLVINEVMPGPGGWVELFNTANETVSGPSLAGVVLEARLNKDAGSARTAQRSLSTDSFPPRSFKVITCATPGAGELGFGTGDPGQPKRIEPTGRIQFAHPNSPFHNDDFFFGRPRAVNTHASGGVSEGRVWDGGPRGYNGDLFDPAFEPAAFAGTTASNPAHPVTKGASNTADYLDALANAQVRQPYFQAVLKRDGSCVWLYWRHLGHLGPVWESDGLRLDYAALRVEGTALSGSNLYAGLRSPLTRRRSGNALVYPVPTAAFVPGSATDATWGTVSLGAASSLNLNGQGIRGMAWCPQIEGGRYLIVAGPPSTLESDDKNAAFSLWAWAGPGTQPVLRVADLRPYAKKPTGISAVALSGQMRLVFSEGLGSSEISPEAERVIHWPVSILSSP